MTLITLRAEIGAAVWKIAAPADTSVLAEEPVVILESMKMEIPISAPMDGVVVDILVREGEMVEEGQAVATLRT